MLLAAPVLSLIIFACAARVPARRGSGFLCSPKEHHAAGRIRRVRRAGDGVQPRAHRARARDQAREPPDMLPED